MRVARVWLVRPLVLAALLLGPLAGCGTTSGTQDAPTAPAATPAVGGPTSRPVPAPTTGMDLLELAVAARLRRELAGQGLTLDHLDCPPWRGRENAVVRCTGYLDGLVGTVRVSLSRSPSGTVEFDARLEDGVVATQNLVRRLEAEGWTGVDCGDRAAYRAEVGAQIVCAGHGPAAADGAGSAGPGAATSYVVATVTDESGAVEIRAW